MKDDIIQEILLRLPVKSLAKCKSLSKEWWEFISRNPAFRKQFMDRNRGCSLMLGFYRSKHQFFLESDEPVCFLPTYNRGISVLNKRKRYEDGSFSLLLEEPPKKKTTSLVLKKSPSFFSDPAVRVWGSSNGFLLCSLDRNSCPLNYVIINPINKLCVPLPVASLSSYFYKHGFICRSTSPHLDTVDYYKIVRGMIDTDIGQESADAYETISSDSSEWRVSYVSGPSSFHMYYYLEIVVSETGLVFVSGTLYSDEAAGFNVENGLFIFDERKEEPVHLMDFPPIKKEQNCLQCIGQSQGSILFAQNLEGQLKIWRMNHDHQGCDGWSLIHHVSMGSWFQQLKCTEFDVLLIDPHAFHAMDQNVIFLNHRRKRLAYDLHSSKVKSLYDIEIEGSDSNIFLSIYRWSDIPHLFLCD